MFLLFIFLTYTFTLTFITPNNLTIRFSRIITAPFNCVHTTCMTDIAKNNSSHLQSEINHIGSG